MLDGVLVMQICWTSGNFIPGLLQVHLWREKEKDGDLQNRLVVVYSIKVYNINVFVLACLRHLNYDVKRSQRCEECAGSSFPRNIERVWETRLLSLSLFLHVLFFKALLLNFVAVIGK